MKPKFQKLDEAPREYRNFSNLDEGESIFFARELEHVKSQSYDIKYPELKARSVFPIDFTVHQGAETVTYEQYSQVGMAKIVSNYADDLPRADVKGKEFTARVRTIAASYGYNYDEISAASKANKPLAPRKANSAKRAHMVLENKIAFFGDAEHDIVGFINNPNISEVTLAADGTGASKLFSSKTPDQVLRDLNSLFTYVHTISNGVETANTLLIPLQTLNDLATRRVTDTDVSILQWFLKNSPHCKEVVWLDELKAAGAASTKRMISYRRDPMALELIITSEFKQLPVQEKNLEYIVPTHHRMAGVLVYYPLSVAFADGF